MKFSTITLALVSGMASIASAERPESNGRVVDPIINDSAKPVSVVEEQGQRQRHLQGKSAKFSKGTKLFSKGTKSTRPAPSISGQPSSNPSESPSVSAKPSSQPSENPSISDWPTSQPSTNPSISGVPSSQVSEEWICIACVFIYNH